MRKVFEFIAALTVGLGALSLTGYFVLERTTRKWFETDVAMRSLLAVTAARQSLIQSVLAGPERLGHTLADITRDDRIMSAAVCSAERQLLVSTEAFPSEFGCEAAQNRLVSEGHPLGRAARAMLVELPAGRRDRITERLSAHQATMPGLS